MRHFLHLYLGDWARGRAMWSMAERHYQRHLRMFPDDAALWVQLGHARKERGALSSAAIAYQRALYLRPYDADIYLHMGRLHQSQGNAVGAIGAFRRALELHPGFADAQNALGQVEGLAGPTSQMRLTVLEDQLAAMQRRLTELENNASNP